MCISILDVLTERSEKPVAEFMVCKCRDKKDKLMQLLG